MWRQMMSPRFQTNDGRIGKGRGRLVSVLFTGPALLVVNFYTKFLYKNLFKNFTASNYCARKKRASNRFLVVTSIRLSQTPLICETEPSEM